MHRVFKSIFFAGVLGLVLGGQAIAHAHLESATPAVDSTVAASPAELDLKFSEALELKFSGVKVAGPGNAAVTTGPASFGKDDESALVVPVSAALAGGIQRSKTSRSLHLAYSRSSWRFSWPGCCCA